MECIACNCFQCALHLGGRLFAPRNAPTALFPYAARVACYSAKASSSFASEPPAAAKAASDAERTAVNASAGFFQRLFGGKGIFSGAREQQAVNAVRYLFLFYSTPIFRYSALTIN